MTYSPTYRYAVGIFGIFGGSYVQPDQATRADWVMAETLKDVERILLNFKDNYPYRYDVNGAGDFLGNNSDTPGYGDPGDGAYIYRVNRDHPDFSEVLDEPGDRARHAFGYVDFDYPAYFATFGPRGGLKIERAA